ncbi:MAG: hypothetical protein KJ046_00460 [Anaerolineae bacterium]|nr:hypothetical protein [Anaerolineae bacterium]
MVNGTGFMTKFESNHGRELISRKLVIAIILAVALVAFEIFNFDTTQYALTNLLGEIRFAGVLWASILAIAFCAIDFAGLVRLFTPQRGLEEPKAIWFLTGAWFLGTIANSVMTWWAISLTLLSHEFGNEVLSRETLLRYVPIFVAMLVWLTRILFIGAFSVAGGDVLDQKRDSGVRTLPSTTTKQDSIATQPAKSVYSFRPETPERQPQTTKTNTVATASAQPKATPKSGAAKNTSPQSITYEPVDDPFDIAQAPPKTGVQNGPSRPTSRIQQRPPMPGMGRPQSGNVQARSSKPGN